MNKIITCVYFADVYILMYMDAPLVTMMFFSNCVAV